MTKDLEFTLDELINFILTDNYIEYSVDKIIQLRELMENKLKLINDKDEHEFYEGVIDGLIIEMTDHLHIAEKEKTNPLKSKYEDISGFLGHDIRKAIVANNKFSESVTLDRAIMANSNFSRKCAPFVRGYRIYTKNFRSIINNLSSDALYGGSSILTVKSKTTKRKKK